MNDTVVVDTGALYFLQVPDSLKSAIVILTDNAMFVPVNDSIIRLKYLRNHQYELVYERLPQKENNFGLRSGVNGASSVSTDKIRIRIFSARGGDKLLENVLICK